jgi:hypothetical protein
MRTFTFFALAAALILPAGVGQAATIVNSYGPFGEFQLPAEGGQFMIHSFDLRLGRLDSVLLSLTVTSNGGSASFDNENPYYVYMSIEIGSRGFISPVLGANYWYPVAGASSYASSMYVQNAYCSADSDDLPNFIGSDACSTTTPSPYNWYTANYGYDDMNDMQYYINFPNPGGDIPMYGGIFPHWFNSPAWDELRLNSAPMGSITATITYNYTVPEPATLSLLGLGGLAILKRKRGF